MEIAVLLAIALRSFLAVTTRTFFQPDEYFQSLEPAHQIVFGYGQLTWEWTSARPIRSIPYPILNVPIYWMLKVFGRDESPMLVGTCSPMISSRTSHSEGVCVRGMYLYRFGRLSSCTVSLLQGRIFGSGSSPGI